MTSPAGPGSQLFSSKPPTEPGWGLDLLNASSALSSCCNVNFEHLALLPQITFPWLL